MLPESVCPDELVNCTLSRTLVPFALYSLAGEVRGDTDGSGVDDGAAVGEALGDGLVEGFVNKAFWPTTKKTAIATAATATIPTIIMAFLFLALV